MRVDSTLIACRRTTPLGSTRGFRRTPWVRLRSTDGHCFYAATMRQIDNDDRHEAGRRLNNRAENSHSGASPRCPAPAFPGVHFSNTNSATDTLPSRLPVTTTGRDARGLRSRPSHRRGFRGFAVLGLVCLSAFWAPQAHAEVAIEGGRDEMQVRVENDTVGHVLEALGRNGNLHNRSATPLNKVIDGSFSGSLGQVLFRILDGYDFIIRHDPESVEVFVFGESGAAPIAPPSAADGADA